VDNLDLYGDFHSFVVWRHTVTDNTVGCQSDLGTEHVEVAIQSWNHTQADGCLAMTFTGLVTWLFRPEVALEDAKS